MSIASLLTRSEPSSHLGSDVPSAWARPAWSILVVGGALTIALFAATALDVAGGAMWWEIGHWTLTAAMAVGLAMVGARATVGAERRIRSVAAGAMAVYLGGQLLWDGQVVLGMYPVPSPSDVLFLGMAAPFVIALAAAIRASGSRRDVRTFVLDAAVLVAAVVAVVTFTFASVAAGAEPGLGVVLLLYPIVYLGLAGSIIVAALLARSPISWRGPYLAAAGITVLGGNWVWYLSQAVGGQPTTGSVINMLGSVGAVMIGLGIASWRVAPSPSERYVRAATQVLWFLPVGAISLAAAVAVLSVVGRAGITPVEVAAALVVIVAILRQTLLLGDQTDHLERERRASERERELRERAQQALASRETSEKRYRTLVEVFDRLGEQTTFAADDGEMFMAAAGALAQLVPTTAGDILAINPSGDRLSVQEAWGEGASAVGSVVDVDAPALCFGIRRGGVFDVEDASDPWTPSCPAHRAERGSTMCVPMITAGKVIGVVHLARRDSRAFGEDDRRHASRIAEQVALAVSNARLIRTMEGLALTDGLTGLHNGRFFDPFLDRELAHADRDGSAVGVIAVDLDHFKVFNDTHGHPAGDEALRTFAHGCLAALRKSDTMARMGGEEFLIAVPGADLAATTAIAEKLRVTVEHLPVEIGPGRFARITASFGAASSERHGTDRMALLKAADRALYAAKRQGRNAVVAATSRPKPVAAATPDGASSAAPVGR